MAPDRRAAEAAGEARGARLGLDLPFRIVLTVGFIAAAVVPLLIFGLALLAIGWEGDETSLISSLALAVAVSILVALLVAYLVGGRLTAPLRRITTAIERVAAGEAGPPIHLTGDDELARLAESHNRIADDVRRRNAALAALLEAIAAYAPRQGVASLAAQAGADARAIFGLIDGAVRLDPADAAVEERVPGDPRPVRATVRAGAEPLGVLAGHLPATRDWEHADQDLLELFASEVGVALRNAELFGQIETQNARLLELDAAKDEFLRGVSHNLQTPLTSIRAYVDQMRASGPDAETDRRLAIVAEQTARLTRLVRQLLTVTRIEAGVLRSQPEVLALGPRIQRAWEALNAPAVHFALRDRAIGWLAVADSDQLDQVLWALLDNAVKYGGGTDVEVEIRADPKAGRLQATISDHGPGIARASRAQLFQRFARGSGQPSGEGTGLGLYLSRQLLRGMDGDVVLERQKKGQGAAFTLTLPGEPPAAAP